MKLTIPAAFAVTAIICSCASDQPMPLLFAQSHILGISVQTGASGQPPDFTFGYKSFDIAVVPVAVKGSPDGSLAKDTQIKASMNHGGVDSLSVLGQFQTNTGVSSSGGTNVALGEFFATGVAAQALAVGFGTQLCNSNAGSGSSGSGGSSTSGSSSGSSGSGATASKDCGAVFSNLTAAIASSSSSSSGSSSSSSGSGSSSGPT